MNYYLNYLIHRVLGCETLSLSFLLSQTNGNASYSSFDVQCPKRIRKNIVTCIKYLSTLHKRGLIYTSFTHCMTAKLERDMKVSDDLQHKYPSLKWICFTRSNRQRGLQQVHPNTNYYCHVRRHPPGKKELQNKHALSDVPLWRIEGSQTHSDKYCAPNHSLYIQSIPKETAWSPLPPSLKVRKVCFKRAKTLDVYVKWLYGGGGGGVRNVFCDPAWYF